MSTGLPVGGGPGDALDGLSPVACGCLLTLALSADPAGGDEHGALAALVDPDAAACRAGLAALGALDRAERGRAMARLLRRARAPVPDGIERVHPGWLRAALENETTPVLRALTDGLPPEVRAVAHEIAVARDEDGAEVAPAMTDGVLAELRRAVFASLTPMPGPADSQRADAPAWLRLAVLPLAALLTEIDRRGAATLGTSLAGAPPAVVARAAAAAGSALAPAVLEAVRGSHSEEARRRARALVSRAAEQAAEDDVSVATILGLLALAAELAPPTASARACEVIARRLPPRLGRILLDGAGAHLP